MKNLIILIPPSEGKVSLGRFPPFKKISKEIQHMLDQLSNIRDGEWGKILGVKGKALEKAVTANKNILVSKTLPAIGRYSGVVYKAVDYPSLSVAARKAFDRHIRIVSAVFGLVKPQDKIPDYKLKIDKLGADKYWRPIHQKKLDKSFVIDLLPKAHQKAVAYTNGMVVDFNIRKNGKKVSAGHHGKHIKGRFIRWLVQQSNVSVDMIENFNEDGYKWDGITFVKAL